MAFQLTKSRYCAALRCDKLLWLMKHPPEDYPIAGSGAPQARIDAGIELGKKAWELFGFPPVIPLCDSAAQMTTGHLNTGTPYIAEATFNFENLHCRVDILKNLGNRRVEIYEVKSSSGIDKKVKKEKPNEHLNDLAFQYYVLDRLGYTVERAWILYPNKSYVLAGTLDWQAFFSTLDLTEAVRAEQENVHRNVARMTRCLALPQEPEIKFCASCFQNNGCGGFAYCSRNLPENNIFQLTGLSYDKKLPLWEQGYVSMQDLLHGSSSGPALDENLRNQILCALEPGRTYINRPKIREFLSQKNLPYPLYFLDFESFQSLIPLYQGTHPDQRIIFQYSLHFIQEEGGEVQHREFLGHPDQDPHRALAEQLCRDIPRDGTYTVLAYSQSVEKSYINELKKLFPDLSDHLGDIHDHIKDLADPFRYKHYYTGAMKGKYSIKKVLPALFPGEKDLDYHELEGVQNGSDALDAYQQMLHMSPEDQQKTREQLKKYCCLDTFAMVRIWQKLREAAGEE